MKRGNEPSPPDSSDTLGIIILILVVGCCVAGILFAK
jgi:hypothetical protein